MFNNFPAAIPSPESGALHIGPLTLHAYGICIALGVLAAVWLATKRWVARGGNEEDMTVVAMWGVPFGIIGARVYHVITDAQLYDSQPVRVLYIWDGGLGIWGGIAGGVIAGLIVGRKRGLPLLDLLDTVAPALALSQAIGRFGNYFNQELFGKPTTLPWGLEIDVQNRPVGYENVITFHPTFLYESLWCLSICVLLILMDRQRKLLPGQLFLVYVAMYTFGRFFIEMLRIDQAHVIFGLRLNEWTSLAIFVTAVGLLVVSTRSRKNSPTRRPRDPEASDAT